MYDSMTHSPSSFFISSLTGSFFIGRTATPRRWALARRATVRASSTTRILMGHLLHGIDYPCNVSCRGGGVNKNRHSAAPVQPRRGPLAPLAPSGGEGRKRPAL